MLVVAVVLLLVSAVALPQLTKMPRRIETESALTGIRIAFTETATRARATGTDLRLTLDADEGQFLVSEHTSGLEVIRGWNPPAKRSEETEKMVSVAISSKESYDISDKVEWSKDGDWPEDGPAFVFCADGQASGKPLQFSIFSRNYELDVDRLTGDPLIQELQ